MKLFIFRILSIIFRRFTTELFVRFTLFLPASFTLFHLKKLGAKIDEQVTLDIPVYFHNYNNKSDTPFKNLSIGKDVYIGRRCFFDLRGQITLENNVTVAMNVSFITHTDLFKSKLKEKILPLSIGNICIKSDSYIGAGTTILENVTIDQNCIIGAASLVNKNIPKDTVAFGQPCKVVKKIII